MKKFLLSLFAVTMLGSCTKKETVGETEFSDTDSSIVADTPPVSAFKSIEYSPEQVTEFLSAKENDTLYVTNFFATWCGPCIREIPHFKEKMEELKGQPVKFTFISLDQKSDWDTKVKDFAEEKELSENIILLDGTLLNEDFFAKNFESWDGSGIPFTFMRKKNRTDEYMSMMTKEQLDEKINSFSKNGK